MCQHLYLTFYVEKEIPSVSFCVMLKYLPYTERICPIKGVL